MKEINFKNKMVLGCFIELLCLGGNISVQAATITAASCNYSDVNAVINGPTHTAVNGDMIIIPAGTCTWTSDLIVLSNVGFTLMGSGAPQFGSGTVGAPSSCTATQILDNAGSSGFLMSFSPTYGNSTMRVSCMAIDPATTGALTLYAPIGINGTCTSSGCPAFRIDNITFGLTNQWTETNNGSQAAALTRLSNAFGVLDHNTAPSGSNAELFVAHLEAYLGIGDFGDESWAQPNSLGGANNVFAENNLWNTQYLSLNDCEAPLPYGCRFVDRYNTITQSSAGSFGIAQNHGTDTTGRARSGREMEVYGNTLNCQSACAGVDGGLRGGTGLFWNNHANLTPDQGATTWVGISLYRNVMNNEQFGACGGDGPWDQNDGTIYYSGTVGSVSNGGFTMTDTTKSFGNLVPVGAPYSIYDVTQGFWAEVTSNTSTTITILSPISESGWSGMNAADSYQVIRATLCIDQAGRGLGNYLSGSSTNCSMSFNLAPTYTGGSPCGWSSEALEPIYQWGDNYSGGANVNNPIEASSGRIINYRDYYAQASGVQTSSTSPFSCNGTNGATGWGTLANRPASCSGACSANSPGCGYFATDQGSQGTLYVWNSGAWTTYYTPYTYPHPLDSSTNSVVYGDLSGAANGAVTIYDAELVAQYVVGLITLTPTQLQAAEVSSATETAPTIYDAFLIAEYAVGLITQFPVQ